MAVGKSSCKFSLAFKLAPGHPRNRLGERETGTERDRDTETERKTEPNRGLVRKGKWSVPMVTGEENIKKLLREKKAEPGVLYTSV